MKFIFSLIILCGVNISNADLATDLAQALKESSIDKQVTKLNLQVDDKSVDAKWSTEKPVVLKENSDLYVDVAAVTAADFIPATGEEEVRDEVREIAREIKASHSVAKEVFAKPVVDAR